MKIPVISLVLVGMMHYLSTVISWLICVLVVVVSACLTGALWWAWYSVKSKRGLSSNYSIVEEYLRNETAIYVLAIIATIVMVILILVVFFLKNKLTGLTALFEESGKCMFSLPGLAVPPIIAFGALALFLVFWVIVVVCIISSTYPIMSPSDGSSLSANAGKNDLDISNKTFDSKLFYVEYIDAGWIRNMLWVYFVGLIWTSEFIFACQQFTLAGAVAFWYFKKPTDTPTFYAMGKLLKYHLGSVAKGSFVITLFKVPRLILTYLYTK